MSGPTATDGPSVTVNDSNSLSQAYQDLSTSGGGTIYLTPGDEPYAIRLAEGGSDHVRIVSADPNDPVDISRIKLDLLENVTIENVSVNSSHLPRPSWDDLQIYKSSGVEIKNSVFQSDAFTFAGEGPSSWQEVGFIRESSDVELSGNHFSNYVHGLYFRDSYDIVFEDNDVTQMQGDGLRIEGVQGLRIEGNDFYDFLGSPNDLNHDDMIQMFAMNTDIISRDIEIIGNTFVANDEVASQTIFLGNEKGQFKPEYFTENITIKDNVVYNGHLSGIRVSDARNVVVENNTVLWNQSANLEGQNHPPAIFLTRIDNGEITNNITSGIRTEGSEYGNVDVSGNETISYGDPTSESFVLDHFANVGNAGDVDFRDLSLLPDSEWLGLGAPMSQPGAIGGDSEYAVMSARQAPDDIWAWSFDAGLSTITGNDLSYVWTFGDGTTLTGETVEHIFAQDGNQSVTLSVLSGGSVVDSIDRVVQVDNRDFFEFDFVNSGLEDLVDDGARFIGLDDDNLGSKGYRIGGNENFSVNRATDTIHALRNFGIEITIDPAGSDVDGALFYMHNVLGSRITEEGAVRFGVTTSEGRFTVFSEDGVFSDGGSHVVGILYDDAEQSLKMLIDGEVVSEVYAAGVTAPKGSHGLFVGHPWNSAVDAHISSLYMGYNLDGPPDTVSAPQDPPADDPVVEDPVEEPADDPAEDPVAEDPVEDPPEDPVEEPAEDPVAEDPPPPPPPAEDPVDPVDPDDPQGSPDISTAFLAFDFADSGLEDLSGQGAKMQGLDEDNLSDAGYRIGGRENFTVSRSNSEIHKMDAFGIEITIDPAEDDADGALLYMHNVMGSRITEEGAVRFGFRTDEGVFSVFSEDGVFSDGGSHVVGIVYDGAEQSLKMLIDGEVVSETFASGETAPRGSHGLVVGHPWNSAADVNIASFYMGPDLDSAPSEAPETDAAGEPAAEGFFFELAQASAPEEPVVTGLEEETSPENPETTEANGPGDVVTIDFASQEMDGAQTVQTGDGAPVDMVDAAAGYRIGEGEQIVVPQNAVELGGLDGFRMEIEMGLNAVGEEGIFLFVPGMMTAEVLEDGHVVFGLETEDGLFEVESTEPVFGDTESRNLALLYDAEKSALEMYADNEIVGMASARGQTEENPGGAITIGGPPEDSLEAWVESFSFASGPEPDAETYDMPTVPQTDATLEELAAEQMMQEEDDEDGDASSQMVA